MLGDHRPLGVFGPAAFASLSACLLLGIPGSAPAEDATWSFRLEPMFLDVYGHDSHVLTIHEIDLDGTPVEDTQTGVRLDTDSGIAYRAEVRYAKGPWAFGLDYFLVLTSQSADDRTAAAGGGIDRAVFEVAGRNFTSSEPGEVLFWGILEDTDLEAWTIDLYALRTLSEAPGGRLALQFGVRFADFDNDYHAAVGVRDVAGRRQDSSSNYGRMTGPLVGIAGTAAAGRSSFEGYLGQSVVLGSAELTAAVADFTGPFSESPSVVSREVFHAEQDVAIPITELRLKWLYGLSDVLSFGVGAQGSAWWDVPVPPGLAPAEGGRDPLHEDTIVFFGLLGVVRVAF